MSLADTVEIEVDSIELPQEERLQSFWAFVSERHRIFERRLDDPTAECWTDDPILAKYKFTNTFRAADRVSQFVIQNIVGNDKLSAHEHAFRAVLFRIFNMPATWNALCSGLEEQPALTNWDPARYNAILTDAALDGIQLWNPAYTISPPDNGYPSKHEAWLWNLDSFIRDGMFRRLCNMRSLQGLYSTLRSMPTVGNFYAFQWAIDINYSRHFSFDENTFVVPGPGAVRGFRKLLPDWEPDRADAAIYWLQSVQDAELSYRGLPQVRLAGKRQLMPIDIQNCLCEFDKYTRERFPQLNTNGAHIKQLFVPHVSLINYRWPSNWKLR